MADGTFVLAGIVHCVAVILVIGGSTAAAILILQVVLYLIRRPLGSQACLGLCFGVALGAAWACRLGAVRIVAPFCELANMSCTPQWLDGAFLGLLAGLVASLITGPLLKLHGVGLVKPSDEVRVE